MPALTIMFEGLCCFVEPPQGRLPGVGRRAILQNMSTHQPPHDSYIEFYETDFDRGANTVWEDGDLSDSYWRFNYTYRHVKVSNARIVLTNPILSPSLTYLQSFHECIPKLPKVCRSFTNIQERFLQPTIGSGIVGAYFDITAGVLFGGPTEEFSTKFEPEQDWPSRHLAQWAQLELQIEGTAPHLLVYDLATQNARPLILKPGTNTITIGNQTENDRLGVPPNGNSLGHFAMYYDLALGVSSKPAPAKDQLGLGTGCVPASWSEGDG